MQPPTSYDWSRALTPARWFASIVAGGAFVVWVGFMILWNLGGGSESIAITDTQFVIWGLLGVGLVVAIAWKGIGEVVGGLAIIGGAVGMVFDANWGIVPLVASVAFAAPGLLFIACGWYTLAKARHHAPRAMA